MYMRPLPASLRAGGRLPALGLLRSSRSCVDYTVMYSAAIKAASILCSQGLICSEFAAQKSREGYKQRELTGTFLLRPSRSSRARNCIPFFPSRALCAEGIWQDGIYGFQFSKVRRIGDTGHGGLHAASCSRGKTLTGRSYITR